MLHHPATNYLHNDPNAYWCADCWRFGWRRRTSPFFCELHRQGWQHCVKCGAALAVEAMKEPRRTR